MYCFLLLVVASGCLRSVTTDPPLALEERATGATTQPQEAAAAAPDLAEGWYCKLSAGQSSPDAYRWQHAGLTELQTAQWTQLAGSKNAAIAATAVVGLARAQPGVWSERLVSCIASRDVPSATRCAAVETLARDPSAETEPRLRRLLTEYGPQGNDTRLCCELLVGLARHVDAAQEPLFAQALDVHDPELQVTVLALLARQSARPVPESVVVLLASPHARVRSAALSAVVAGQHADALIHVRQALRDADLHVRLQAIERLGAMSGRDSLLVLEDLLHDASERHREAAAAALVARQEWTGVERAAKDSSYRVRMAVATTLQDHGAPQRQKVAEMLLNDASAVVQAKMAESLAAWPKEIAVPLLLKALASPNMLTRKTAAGSLAALWPEAQAFPYAASAEERTTSLAALHQTWQQAHPLTTAVDEREESASNATELAQVAQWLHEYQSPSDTTSRWQAQRRLEELGPRLVLLLHKLQERRQVVVEEVVYRELLPAVDNDFAMVEKLRSLNLSERRAAARHLASQAARQPLGPMMLQRLEQVAGSEADSLVWGDLLRAAGETSDFVCEKLALAALEHSESDVRRRGCEYLQRCGMPQQAAALLAVLDDHDPLVVKAALAALVRCGPVETREKLYEKLSASDVHLQLAAAQTLAAWQDERGAAALERLALATSPLVRRQAMVSMGQVGDPTFLQHLIAALDDQPAVRLAALEALPKVAGEDPIPSTLTLPDDRIQAWKTWHEGIRHPTTGN